MFDVSSHGRVAPKTKTINVNANLLSQRLAEREQIREWVRKRLMFIAVCVVVAFVVLPPLHRAQINAAAVSAQLKKQQAIVAKQLEALQAQQKDVKPVVDNEHLLNSVRKNSHEFLGHMLLFLDNVSPSISLSGLSATVGADGVELSTTADAVNYRAAQDFIEGCEHSPGVLGTYVKQMRNNTSVAEDGVSFDISQKVKVGQ